MRISNFKLYVQPYNSNTHSLSLIYLPIIINHHHLLHPQEHHQLIYFIMLHCWWCHLLASHQLINLGQVFHLSVIVFMKADYCSFNLSTVMRDYRFVYWHYDCSLWDSLMWALSSSNHSLVQNPTCGDVDHFTLPAKSRHFYQVIRTQKLSDL